MLSQRDSLTLLTDLYQLTMAYGYWKTGVHEKEAAFHLFFRRNPFGGGYAVACGLSDVMEYLDSFRFTDSDLEYLSGLTGGDGEPLFEAEFLRYLGGLRLRCDVWAVAEGTVVFPQEPLLRVQGPILHCQILETPLLNLINFSTLVATKAARICTAARGEPVVEFGLRRAQGPDGAVTASRAAYVGGCAATSNLLAGKRYGIPVKGTHAHSWVMSFDSESESFEAYARAMPNNCVFLVDTYETLNGVRHAIETGRWLRSQGHEMAGIRLDSGDLAYLSIEARKMLDAAGFPDAVIVGSNDLDEHVIASLKEQGATIGVWGVGTRLATAYDDPALGGVYKLGAIQDAAGRWGYKIKISDQSFKSTNPGIQQVRRFRSDGCFCGDAIYDTVTAQPSEWTIVDPRDMTRQKRIDAGAAFEDLLEPVVKGGKPVKELPTIHEARGRTAKQLSGFHAGTKRFLHPHEYPVGLEAGLHQVKVQLTIKAREGTA